MQGFVATHAADTVSYTHLLFYYTILDEVVDATDDTLENYGEILMESALHDPSILETEGWLMSFYKFTPISEEEGRHYRQGIKILLLKPVLGLSFIPSILKNENMNEHTKGCLLYTSRCV